MVNEKSETWPRVACDPFQHLKITIGVTESGNEAATDRFVNGHCVEISASAECELRVLAITVVLAVIVDLDQPPERS